MAKELKRITSNYSEDAYLEKLDQKILLLQEEYKKPGKCLKYITTIIGTNIIEESFGSCIISNLTDLAIKYEVKSDILPNIILWQRQNQPTFIQFDNFVSTELYEDAILYILTASELNELMKNGHLLPFIRNLQYMFNEKQIMLLIYGLKEYCHHHKNNTSHLIFERALTQIQLMANVNHRLLSTAEEVGYTIVQFTKAIAEKPYKKDCADRVAEQHFYVANDNKDCVHVKGEAGLANLWQKHLTKFPLISMETAEAIIGKYSNPSKLLREYQKQNINGSNLLSSIPIKRAGSTFTAFRKVGPELSKKVHTFFTNSEPDCVI